MRCSSTKCASIKLLGGLSLLTTAILIAPIAQAVDQPICFVQLPGQSMRNLSGLCGVNDRPTAGIDLSIDADGDGISDQLLAEMQKFRSVMSQAKSAEEYSAALRNFESRLPYSNNVKRLQTQQQNLRDQLRQSPGGSQNSDLYRQLDQIQQQIFKDPSYTKVQQEMSKVYRKLN